MKFSFQFIALLASSAFVFGSCSKVEDTDDIASLVVGTYVGDAADKFTSEKELKVEITRIGDTQISIEPLDENTVNSQFNISLVRDGNVLRQSEATTGVTFEARVSKKSIPMSFSVEAPFQSFDGRLQ